MNFFQAEDGIRDFFQAEDGIRDLRMSRGLGDVYKRQEIPGSRVGTCSNPVSYTHLTLPTTSRV
ncbi:hypothetical protein JMUB7532_27670 [Staphylococcus aureus]